MSTSGFGALSARTRGTATQGSGKPEDTYKQYLGDDIKYLKFSSEVSLSDAGTKLNATDLAALKDRLLGLKVPPLLKKKFDSFSACVTKRLDILNTAETKKTSFETTVRFMKSVVGPCFKDIKGEDKGSLSLLTEENTNIKEASKLLELGVDPRGFVAVKNALSEESKDVSKTLSDHYVAGLNKSEVLILEALNGVLKPVSTWFIVDKTTFNLQLTSAPTFKDAVALKKAIAELTAYVVKKENPLTCRVYANMALQMITPLDAQSDLILNIHFPTYSNADGANGKPVSLLQQTIGEGFPKLVTVDDALKGHIDAISTVAAMKALDSKGDLPLDHAKEAVKNKFAAFSTELHTAILTPLLLNTYAMGLATLGDDFKLTTKGDIDTLSYDQLSKLQTLYTDLVTNNVSNTIKFYAKQMLAHVTKLMGTQLEAERAKMLAVAKSNQFVQDRLAFDSKYSGTYPLCTESKDHGYDLKTVDKFLSEGGVPADLKSLVFDTKIPAILDELATLNTQIRRLQTDSKASLTAVICNPQTGEGMSGTLFQGLVIIKDDLGLDLDKSKKPTLPELQNLKTYYTNYSVKEGNPLTIRVYAAEALKLIEVEIKAVEAKKATEEAALKAAQLDGFRAVVNGLMAKVYTHTYGVPHDSALSLCTDDKSDNPTLTFVSADAAITKGIIPSEFMPRLTDLKASAELKAPNPFAAQYSEVQSKLDGLAEGLRKELNALTQASLGRLKESNAPEEVEPGAASGDDEENLVFHFDSPDDGILSPDDVRVDLASGPRVFKLDSNTLLLELSGDIAKMTTDSLKTVRADLEKKIANRSTYGYAHHLLKVEIEKREAIDAAKLKETEAVSKLTANAKAAEDIRIMAKVDAFLGLDGDEGGNPVRLFKPIASDSKDILADLVKTPDEDLLKAGVIPEHLLKLSSELVTVDSKEDAILALAKAIPAKIKEQSDAVNAAVKGVLDGPEKGLFAFVGGKIGLKDFAIKPDIANTKSTDELKKIQEHFKKYAAENKNHLTLRVYANRAGVLIESALQEREAREFVLGALKHPVRDLPYFTCKDGKVTDPIELQKSSDSRELVTKFWAGFVSNLLQPMAYEQKFGSDGKESKSDKTDQSSILTLLQNKLTAYKGKDEIGTKAVAVLDGALKLLTEHFGVQKTKREEEANKQLITLLGGKSKEQQWTILHDCYGDLDLDNPDRQIEAVGNLMAKLKPDDKWIFQTQEGKDVAIARMKQMKTDYQALQEAFAKVTVPRPTDENKEGKVSVFVLTGTELKLNSGLGFHVSDISVFQEALAALPKSDFRGILDKAKLLLEHRIAFLSSAVEKIQGILNDVKVEGIKETVKGLQAYSLSPVIKVLKELEALDAAFKVKPVSSKKVDFENSEDGTASTEFQRRCLGEAVLHKEAEAGQKVNDFLLGLKLPKGESVFVLKESGVALNQDVLDKIPSEISQMIRLLKEASPNTVTVQKDDKLEKKPSKTEELIDKFLNSGVKLLAQQHTAMTSRVLHGLTISTESKKDIPVFSPSKNDHAATISNKIPDFVVNPDCTLNDTHIQELVTRIDNDLFKDVQCDMTTVEKAKAVLLAKRTSTAFVSSAPSSAPSKKTESKETADPRDTYNKDNPIYEGLKANYFSKNDLDLTGNANSKFVKNMLALKGKDNKPLFKQGTSSWTAGYETESTDYELCKQLHSALSAATDFVSGLTGSDVDVSLKLFTLLGQMAQKFKPSAPLSAPKPESKIAFSATKLDAVVDFLAKSGKLSQTEKVFKNVTSDFKTLATSFLSVTINGKMVFSQKSIKFVEEKIVEDLQLAKTSFDTDEEKQRLAAIKQALITISDTMGPRSGFGGYKLRKDLVERAITLLGGR